jgi:type I restriction enzyme, S subunit
MAIDSSAVEAMLRVSSSIRNLPERWSWGRLEDLCEGVYDCPHSTPKLTTAGPYVVRTQDILPGVFLTASAAHVSEETYRERIARAEPSHGDLLYSREGTYFGIAAEVPPKVRVCLGQRMVLIRPDRTAVDFGFLRYWLNSPIMAAYIHGFRDGSVAERLNLPTIRSLPVLMPSMSEQSAIAEILGALDDKIAVNDQVAGVYEQLLRVRFDGLRIDEDPERSSVAKVSEIIEFNPALHPPRGVEAVYLDMAAVPTTRATVLEWSKREPKSGTRFANGDTVMARITPCLENGKTAFIDFMEDGEIGIGSTEFIIMRARPGIPMHLSYFLARSPRFRTYAVQNMVGSSGRQRVNATQLFDFPLRRPDSTSLSAFGAAASMAFTHTRSLANESRNLAELRDTLLPKLMSGEIRVRDAEKVVEDVT